MAPFQFAECFTPLRVVVNVLGKFSSWNIMRILFHIRQLLLSLLFRQIEARHVCHPLGHEDQLGRLEICTDPQKSIKVRLGHHLEVLRGEQHSRHDHMTEESLTSRSDCGQVSCAQIETIFDANHVANDPPEVTKSVKVLWIIGYSESLVINDDMAHKRVLCNRHVTLVDKVIRPAQSNRGSMFVFLSDRPE